MQRASRLAASKFRNLAPSNNVICRSFCNTGFLKNKKEGDFKEKFKQQFSQLERILEEDRKTLDLISFGTTVEAADLAKHPFYTYDVKLYQMGWDSEFNEKEFLEGAKEAFLTLRELLVEDPTQLEALFTPDAYDGFKEWLKFVTEDKNCKIYGNVDKIDEVQILNIRVVLMCQYAFPILLQTNSTNLLKPSMWKMKKVMLWLEKSRHKEKLVLFPSTERVQRMIGWLGLL